MTVLAELADGLITIQCDVCVPPVVTVSTTSALRRISWQLRSEGAPLDVCPNCIAWVAPADRTKRKDPSPVSPDPELLPNLVVIGAMKAGTTSMHNYLDLHPEINVSTDKEARFFQDPDLLDWVGTYQRNFTRGTRYRAESTPIYSKWPVVPGVADRLAELVPDARIIYMVREPIDRIVAEYVEQMQWTAASRPLEVELADPEEPTNSLVASSRYATQLAQFRERFGADRVLVLDLADLAADTPGTMNEVFAFLGLEPLDLTAEDFRTYNARDEKGTYPTWALRIRHSPITRALDKLPAGLRQRLTSTAWRAVRKPVEAPELSAETRVRLEAALKPEADALRAATGRAFANWSV
jgi:hypothetical protein